VEVQPEELLAQIDRHAAPLILDVRSSAEFRAGHLPGAVHLPFWSAFFRDLGLRVRRDDPVVVYCGHGPRAQLAATALRLRGFTEVRLLCGHMSKWRAEGKPIERIN
jgi:rhodanese-related sulfurtransferase